jgi:hypothetical protein
MLSNIKTYSQFTQSYVIILALGASEVPQMDTGYISAVMYV